MKRNNYSKNELLIGKPLRNIIIRRFTPYVVLFALIYRFLELVADNYGMHPILISVLLLLLSLLIFIGIVLKVSSDIDKDITERKLMEDELRRNRDILLATQSIAHLGSWEWNIIDNRLNWSDEVYRIYGIDTADFIPTYEYVIGTIRPDNKEAFIRAIEEALGGNKDFEMEYYLIRSDGEERIVHTIAEVIRDKSGKPLAMIGIVNDITARKNAEEALRESESKFRSLFNQATDSIFLMSIKNDDIIIADINQAACDIHGYSREELIGKSIGVLDDPETRSHIPERAKALTQGVTLRAEAKHMRKDGSVFPVEISAQLIYIASVPYVLAIDRDISERKKSEEILQRDKGTLERLVEERSRQLMDMHEELDKVKRLSDMGTVAATIAHELRNPLAAIQIAAYNIKKKCAGQLIDKHIFNIEKKISESDQIINNLLFYARLKSAHYEKISIYDILEECISYAESRFKEEKVLVSRSLSEVRGFLIDADPLQMKECFVNILNNAFDAVSGKEGMIEIAAKKVDGGHVEILIKDNGIGIGEEDSKKVFDPFFTTKSKGTGLGLTVCSQIIYLHEGAIDIQSKKGEGASVTVVLPFKMKEK